MNNHHCCFIQARIEFYRSIFETTHSELMTWDQFCQLLKNWDSTSDFFQKFSQFPLIEMFTQGVYGPTWLLSSLDPDKPDIGFGVCDYCVGNPEYGYISISEVLDMQDLLGLPVECQTFCSQNKTLTDYAVDARKKGCLTL